MSTVNSGPQMDRNGLVLDLDASYLRSYSPNVHPNPTNIFAWSGTGNNNCTLSGDSTITRQYGSIPLKMVMTGTDPYTGTYNNSSWNLAPSTNEATSPAATSVPPLRFCIRSPTTKVSLPDVSVY